jgi:hypothetical protein
MIEAAIIVLHVAAFAYILWDGVTLARVGDTSRQVRPTRTSLIGR